MFRANRVGTPHIHQIGHAASSLNTALTGVSKTTGGGLIGLNVINAAPLLDFGESKLVWLPGAPPALTANFSYALAQQFTITAPLKGNTVGLELMGQINIDLPGSTTITPFVARLTAALGSVLSGANSHSAPTFIGEGQQSNNSATVIRRTSIYKEQVIINDSDPAVLAGTYAHGFLLTDNTAAAWNVPYARMHAAIRQYNDQQNISYRDTRR